METAYFKTHPNPIFRSFTYANSFSKNRIKTGILWLFLLAHYQAHSCTIFSGKDSKGQLWAGNNEDWLFTFKSYVNIVPASDNSFGYFYFTYNHPNLDQQGGTNDAGLFFNFNYVPFADYTKGRKKEYYPGGTFQLFEHILKHCSTVQEVINLFKKYRLDNLETAQLHIADKYGNLGIIAGDDMRITQAKYQVSTNYNVLCAPKQNEEECWRMPIAQRILERNEPSFESFTQICDSTHQYDPEGAGTIYSNVQNLSTGEIWLYYELDYKKPYKTSIKELLALGDTSIFMHDFFQEQELVKGLKLCEKGEYQQAITTMNSIQDTKHRNEVLSYLATGLIETGGMFDAYPVYEAYLKSKEPSISDIVNKSINLYCIGKKEEAMETVNNQLLLYPDNPALIRQKKRLNGQFDQACNYRIELEGYENAKHVVVDNFWLTKTDGFMTKVEDKWILELQLYPGEFYFAFYIDGKRLTPSQFHSADFNGIPYNMEKISRLNYLFSKMKLHHIN